MGSSDAIRIREGRPSDEAAIGELFETTFGRHRSPAYWRWLLHGEPSARVVVLVAEAEERVVGSISYRLGTAYAGDRELIVRISRDLMVEEQWRSRGIMHDLVEPIYEVPCDFSLNFPSDRTASLVVRYGFGAQAHRMHQAVRWRSAAVYRRDQPRSLARGVRSLAVWVLGFVTSRRPKAPQIVLETVSVVPSGIDRLFEHLRTVVPFVTARSEEWLRWRWLEQPDRDWSFIVAKGSRDEVLGYVVVGPDPKPRASRWVISDLVAKGPRETAVLAAAAWEVSQQAGADVLVFDHRDPRPWTTRALLRAGFFTLRTGPNAATTSIGMDDSSVEDHSNWFLTLADSDLV